MAIFRVNHFRNLLILERDSLDLLYRIFHKTFDDGEILQHFLGTFRQDFGYFIAIPLYSKYRQISQNDPSMVVFALFDRS